MITRVLQSTSRPDSISGTATGLKPFGQRMDTSVARATDTRSKASTTASTQELSDEEQKQAEDLEHIDKHVRAHEAAHQGAAGGLARGKSFTYQQGPDGKQYAVGGEVQIDMSAVEGDPRATIAKMQRVRAAALSPADPSSQDRQVAVQAARTEAQARAELLEQQKTAGSDYPLDETKQPENDEPVSPRERSAEQADATPSNNRLGSIAQRFTAPSFSGTVFSARA